MPWPEDKIKHACYKFYIFIKPDWLHIVNRDRLIEDINSAGVRCFSGSCSEIYNEKCFDELPVSRPPLPLKNASILTKSAIMFEVHPTLTTKVIENNIKLIAACIDKLIEVSV